MKISHSFYLVLLLCVAGNLASQPQQRLIQVQIAADSPDLIYTPGEQVKFTVTVLKNSIPLKDVAIRYEISEDMMRPHLSDKMVMKEESYTIAAGSMEKPGFLRCYVYATYNGKEYMGVATAGFSPEAIQPVTELPDDFQKFWEKAKADASKVPLDPEVIHLPAKSNAKVDVYRVNLQNYEYGSRLYGMLTIPKGEGPFPAILKVPGAGVRAYHGDIANTERGYIIFEIGIHGIPVDMEDHLYQSLGRGALKNYQTFNLDNRDTYYYKRVYLGCVRAVDYLFTLDRFNGSDLISYGGSQGGALAIVAAALDDRIKGLVSFYPALCDMTGYLHGRAGGWPHLFNKVENNTPEKIQTASYYDVVNFARTIKVPGFYSFGYNDMVCPPTTVRSAINVVTAEKEICITENSAHFAYPEQREESWKWVGNFFSSQVP